MQGLIPLLDFSSGGCSGNISQLWKQLLGHIPPFESACIEHGLEYYCGGSTIDRLKADFSLWIGVTVCKVD